MKEHMLKVEDMERFFEMACESVCRKHGISDSHVFKSSSGAQYGEGNL